MPTRVSHPQSSHRYESWARPGPPGERHLHELWTRPAPPPGERARTLWARPAPAPGENRHPPWARQGRAPRTRHVVMGVVLALLVVAAVVVTVIATGGSGYRAAVVGLEPVDTSQVVVTVEVRNGTGTAGTPTCQVQLYSPAYVAGGPGASGTATFKVGHAIPAGATAVYQQTVTVTEGRADAMSAESSNVSCR